MGALELLEQVILLVMTPECFKEFFYEKNFSNVPCLKATLSKCLGLGIIAGSILVKVPQIVKILKNKSAQGISLLATCLELTAIIASVSYNFVNGYPFSSYGDNFFLLLQTATIAALIQHYGGSSQQAVLFLGSIVGVLSVLCSGQVPTNVLWGLQACNIPIVFCGKMLQALANYRQGSTGQLSAVTLTLLTAGSAARIFTSIQETGDSVIIATYCVATFANAVIFSQLMWYWNVKAKPAKKVKRG